MRTLLLLSRDLRVHDHPALHDASAAGEVVPLFVLDDGLLAVSRNRSRFLVEGLRDLDGALADRGGRLVVRRGDPASVAVEVARAVGCDRIAVTQDVSAFARRREATLEAGGRAAGIEVRSYAGNAVVEPGDFAPAGTDGYRVFTPYFRAWSVGPRRTVLPAPKRVVVPDGIASDPLPDPASLPIDAEALPPQREKAKEGEP
ncbi:MAG: deoxyribodipyrimidine photo-lyase, partial [Actinomycetota bacterium]